MKDDFEYGIECNGKLIATFEVQQDRDDCLDFLTDKYDDCQFKSIDNE